ncbi:hypothetical protein Afil01_44480 [Actinorhabdospora filicis]|uniref:Amidohydrolase family protein n=1 Tax=Actinorhabdospora filicis TaxID=1785913 RepID=A0A9W6WBJ9_9ACTN|nr:hypothetical protein [Actinorhabdospora filicis]GLZ79641.1 hypothetical protein Afil01_44480 [Actinorhabdospora filicis]
MNETRFGPTVLIDDGPGASRVRNAAIPLLDPDATFDVTAAEGRITGVRQTGERRADTPELWPGFVETHAHLALPANWDDSVDDPRLIGLQYLYHGVTHVVDMFGFPLVKDLWDKGAAEADPPYPALAHCGYAATSMRDATGRNGHGVEFPAPVHMLGTAGDIEDVLRANARRGGTFLKIMFTDGTEQPGAQVRFSRLSEPILADAAATSAAAGVPAVIDCNTREEVLRAYDCGFRLFAHSVRDVVLSEGDWAALDGARFVSTLAGLRPMVMTREEFLEEYGRPGFTETQDEANLDFVRGVEEPFGISFGLQDTRTAALEVMRANALAALRRGVLLIGTDCGNTGAYHGYSLLSELDLLAGGDPALREPLLKVATEGGQRFFGELAGGSARSPMTEGGPAGYNLLRPAGPLSSLPLASVAGGSVVDRAQITRRIRALRGEETKGKVAP